jgi:GLPGLI family protein
MKKKLMVFMLLTGVAGHTQQKEGVIIYERVQNMHRSVNQEMRAMMPEFKTSQMMLLFSGTKSLYKPIQTDEAPDPFSNRTGGGILSMGANTIETYIDLDQNKQLSSRNALGTLFLIADTVKKYPWVLTDERKTIAGVECRKATMINISFRPVMRVVASTTQQDAPPPPKKEEIEVVAWYAESLAAPAGPEQYTGLPGVILELDVDKSAVVIKTKEVRSNTKELKDLKEPKKGRFVTNDGFRSAVREMLEKGIGNFQVKPLN